MGIPINKKSFLPAPTESLTGDNSGTDQGDTATDVSRRSDRSHYSIPEDGSPITIPTKYIKTEKVEGQRQNSGSSLLIEYYEGDKSVEKGESRPSVRVKVTPRTNKENTTRSSASGERKPSYTKRIPLEDSTIEGAQIRRNQSNQPPVDIEVMHNPSDVGSESRYVAPPSDISSMPPDTTMAAPPVIRTPSRRRDLSPISLEKMEAESNAKEGLQPPQLGRTRSKSKERITRKVLEKLTQEPVQEAVLAGPSEAPRVRTRTKSREVAEEDLKPSKRSSRRESGTESSLLRPRDQDSNVSSGSKVSLNNPKLLQTVEDAIKRLILPEIEEIKRHQSTRSSGRYDRSSVRDSVGTESSMSRDVDRHYSGKSSSSHRPRSSHTREELEALGSPGKHRRRRRHHSHEGESGKSSRRDSIDSVTREKERIKKRREGSRSVSDTATGLTTAALRSHDSQTSTDSYERRHREKKKRRSKRDSQSDSIANTEEEYYNKKEIPSMPMASSMQDSDLTRESILSAETIETERPQTGSSKTAEPEIREVVRGSPQTVSPSHSRTPTKQYAGNRDVEEPSIDERAGMSSRQSNRSTSSKSKSKSAMLAAAGLGAAAGAMYGHDKVKDTGRRSVSGESNRSRDRVTSLEKQEQPSRDTLKSTTSIDYPMTQKRHQGINLEKEEDVLDARPAQDEAPQEEDVDEFYEDQHKLNNEYRNSWDMQSRDLPEGLSTAGEEPLLDKVDDPAIGKAAAGQQLRDVGANAEVVGTPPMPQSAVASLVDQGVSSSQSGQSGSTPGLSRKPDFEELASVREAQQQESPTPAPKGLGQHDNASTERWKAIKDQAAKLSSESMARGKASFDSPRQSAVPSIRSDDEVGLDTNAAPGVGSPALETGHGLDAGSDPNDPSRQPSILEGPLGDAYENAGRWPYEPTTPGSLRREGFVATDDEQFRDLATAGKAGLMGAATGLGIGALANDHRMSGQSQESMSQHGSQASIEQIKGQSTQYSGQYYDRSGRNITPTHLKDEGYISAAQPHSDGGSPLSFSKPPPQLFREGDPVPYSAPPIRQEPRFSNKHMRQLSGNSHGLPAESYDAATGRGLNNIKSQDVVALMDHLTVRDGQRNARDTEILVTLVRSAAEMRESFDGMKKFIENQNNLSVSKTTSHADQTVNKILTTSKSLASGSTRGLRSSTGEKDDLPTKKKNIFQRALKGLGSRNEKDLSRMEDMLMQLLEEVEDLKEMQNSGGSQRPPLTNQGSLTSYERLRAAPDSGYEPDGQAGTGSTSGQSGSYNFSPSGRTAQRMHSGYDMNGDSNNRISTVLERDEEDPDYENDDGMLTPTQEAQQQRSGAFENSPALKNIQFSPNTPKTNDSKGRQKSVSSSLFGIPGIPKISRWSKTTASTAPGDRNDFEIEGPYPGGSRSGSDVNAGHGQDGYYEPTDADRFRSDQLFDEENDGDRTPVRSPSPLIPDQVSLEDPKYQANRHSLPLQHPQPRQGPTNRHQSHLESQAFTYAPHHQNPHNQQYDRLSNGNVSPDNNDAFGSVPSLARNRFSSTSQHQTQPNNFRNTLSPISSDGGYSANSGDANIYQAEATRQYAPPRPPKIKDSGPLVPPARPPKIPHDQPSYPNENSLSSLSSTQSQSRSQSQDASPVPSSEHDHEHPRSHPHHYHGTHLSDAEDDDDDDDFSDGPPPDHPTEDDAFPLPIPLERKQSPYSPGGLLAPIEERYSLEQSRISTPLDTRSLPSARGFDHEDDIEEDEYTPPMSDGEGEADGRITPTLSPPARPPKEPIRKITGPREMPSSARPRPRSNSAEMATAAAQAALAGGPAAAAAPAGVRGTVRRKPAPFRSGSGYVED